MRAQVRISDDFLGALALVAIWPFFIGPIIFGWQCIQWLHFGYWHPVPVSAAFDFFGMPYPTSTWAEVHKTISYILELPLSITSFLVYQAVVVAVMQVEEWRHHRSIATCEKTVMRA
jgi:hypothetical protein